MYLRIFLVNFSCWYDYGIYGFAFSFKSLSVGLHHITKHLIFVLIFRSDPKLFTDDTDIKYCKTLNCCKLPKVCSLVRSI